MKKPKAKREFGKLIKQLKPLRVEERGEVRLSIIERNGERFLDVRFFLKTERYTGPTKTGIMLRAEAVELLLSQERKIRKLLKL